MFRSFLTIGLIALLATSVGCRRKQDFASAFPRRDVERGVYRVDNAEQLRITLQERDVPLDQVWARAVVVLRDEERRRSNLFSVLAVYQEPEKIRLRGSRNPIGTLFEMVLVGEAASISFNREGMRFDGTRSELAERTGALGNLSPADFVDALLVQQRLVERIRTGQPVAITEGRNGFVVATLASDGVRRVVYNVRKEDGLIREYQLREADGSVSLQVVYNGFSFQSKRDVEKDILMPSRFEVYLPQQKFRLTSREVEYKLDERIDQRAFQPPRMREIYPLSQLEFEELP